MSVTYFNIFEAILKYIGIHFMRITNYSLRRHWNGNVDIFACSKTVPILWDLLIVPAQCRSRYDTSTWLSHWCIILPMQRCHVYHYLRLSESVITYIIFIQLYHYWAWHIYSFIRRVSYPYARSNYNQLMMVGGTSHTIHILFCQLSQCDSCNVYLHILQGFFTDTEVIAWLRQSYHHDDPSANAQEDMGKLN